jgi:hypothetical protein
MVTVLRRLGNPSSGFNPFKDGGLREPRSESFILYCILFPFYLSYPRSPLPLRRHMDGVCIVCCASGLGGGWRPSNVLI